MERCKNCTSAPCVCVAPLVEVEQPKEVKAVKTKKVVVKVKPKRGRPKKKK